MDCNDFVVNREKIQFYTGLISYELLKSVFSWLKQSFLFLYSATILTILLPAFPVQPQYLLLTFSIILERQNPKFNVC